MLLEDISIGNWLIDSSDNNHCIVKALRPELIVERFNKLPYSPNIKLLRGIELKRSLLTICGFIPIGNYYKKRINKTTTLKLAFENEVIIWLDRDRSEVAKYIHELQNAHFRLTGVELNPNLFGAPTL